MSMDEQNHAMTAGEHLVIEFNECDQALLDDPAALEEGLKAAASVMNVTVVKCLLHQFSPQGVTGILLLNKAHLTIHTWPEHGYAAVDLYGPAKENLGTASEVLSQALKSKEQSIVTLHRDLLEEGLSQIKDHVPVETTTLDFTGNNVPEGLKVEHSSGRGLGLYATHSYKKDETIYEAPRHLVDWIMELEIKTDSGTSVHRADDYGYEIITDFVKTWPKPVLKMLREYYETDSYEELLLEMTDDGDYGVLVTGINGLQNHSNTPNTILEFKLAEVTIGKDELARWVIPVRALCDIHSGDELFSDYRHALPDFVPGKTWLP